MAGEIVHDDNIAWPERWDEDLFDISLEPIAIDGAIEHHGRDHARQAQTCNQCRGFPVAMRKAHAQPLAFWSAAMRARHIGGRPCFVDKDQTLWVQIKLAREPFAPTRKNIGTILLYRVTSLFLRVMP